MRRRRRLLLRLVRQRQLTDSARARGDAWAETAVHLARGLLLARRRFLPMFLERP